MSNNNIGLLESFRRVSFVPNLSNDMSENFQRIRSDRVCKSKSESKINFDISESGASQKAVIADEILNIKNIVKQSVDGLSDLLESQRVNSSSKKNEKIFARMFNFEPIDEKDEEEKINKKKFVFQEITEFDAYNNKPVEIQNKKKNLLINTNAYAKINNKKTPKTQKQANNNESKTKIETGKNNKVNVRDSLKNIFKGNNIKKNDNDEFDFSHIGLDSINQSKLGKKEAHKTFEKSIDTSEVNTSPNFRNQKSSKNENKDKKNKCPTPEIKMKNNAFQSKNTIITLDKSISNGNSNNLLDGSSTTSPIVKQSKEVSIISQKKGNQEKSGINSCSDSKDLPYRKFDKIQSQKTNFHSRAKSSRTKDKYVKKNEVKLQKHEVKKLEAQKNESNKNQDNIKNLVELMLIMQEIKDPSNKIQDKKSVKIKESLKKMLINENEEQMKTPKILKNEKRRSVEKKPNLKQRREAKKIDFVIKIQRCWRNYFLKKFLNFEEKSIIKRELIKNCRKKVLDNLNENNSFKNIKDLMNQTVDLWKNFLIDPNNRMVKSLILDLSNEKKLKIGEFYNVISKFISYKVNNQE